MENKLQVRDLKISFRTSNGKVQAVRNISFDLAKGEYVGLPTASWSLANFSVADYEAVKAQVADGTIKVDNSTEAMPATVKTTVNEIG